MDNIPDAPIMEGEPQDVAKQPATSTPLPSSQPTGGTCLPGCNAGFVAEPSMLPESPYPKTTETTLAPPPAQELPVFSSADDLTPPVTGVGADTKGNSTPLETLGAAKGDGPGDKDAAAGSSVRGEESIADTQEVLESLPVAAEGSKDASFPASLASDRGQQPPGILGPDIRDLAQAQPAPSMTEPNEAVVSDPEPPATDSLPSGASGAAEQRESHEQSGRQGEPSTGPCPAAFPEQQGPPAVDMAEVEVPQKDLTTGDKDLCSDSPAITAPTPAPTAPPVAQPPSFDEPSLVRGRGRRQKKAPKRFDEEDGKAIEKVQVRRLLEHDDITGALNKREVLLLWPDDGKWYRATVKKMYVKDRKADVFYTETEEQETLDLEALISAQEIAVIDLRIPPVTLEEGEELVVEEEKEEEAKGTPEKEAEAPPLGMAEARSEASSAALKSNTLEQMDEGDDQSILALAVSEAAEGGVTCEEKGQVEKAIAKEKEEKEEEEEAKPPPTKRAKTKKPAAPRKEKPKAPAEGSKGSKRKGSTPPGKDEEKKQKKGHDKKVDKKVEHEGEEADEVEGGREPVQTKQETAAPNDSSAGVEEWTKSILANIIPGAPEKTIVETPDAAAAAPDKAPQAPAPVRQGSLPSNAGPDAVRSKVTAQLKACMVLAAEEDSKAKGESKPVDGGAEEELACEIEEALFELYGSVGKEYRAKYRSLHFNLKDSQNPQLRGRVRARQLLPCDLVRMSALELASKELSEWRKQKEAESAKAVILDVATAAKYSTAAAAEEQQQRKRRGELEVVGYSSTVQLPDETEPEAEDRSEAALGGRVGTAASASDGRPLNKAPSFANWVETQSANGATRGDGAGMPPPESPSSSQAQTPTPSGGQTRVANIFAGAKAARWSDSGEVAHARPSEQDGGDLTTSGGGGAAEDDLDDARSPEWDPSGAGIGSPGGSASDRSRSPSLSPSLSPTPEDALEDFGNLVGPPKLHGNALKMVWEGAFNVPGMGSLAVSVDQMAGTGDLSWLLPPASIEIKGRVGNDKLEPFFSELSCSRSRTVTLGIVKCAANGDHNFMRELLRQYGSKNRSGVAEPGKGLEMYIMPRTDLTARFCITARRSISEAAQRSAIPSNIQHDELLCVFIHRKDWVAPSSKRRPKARQQPPPEPIDTSQTRDDQHEFSPPPDSPPGSQRKSAIGNSNDAGKNLGPQPAAAVSVPPFLAGVGAVPPAMTAVSQSHQQRPPQSGPAAKAPLSVPAGLDLNKLGALAKVLGVNVGGAPQTAAGSNPARPALPSLQQQQQQQMTPMQPQQMQQQTQGALTTMQQQRPVQPLPHHHHQQQQQHPMQKQQQHLQRPMQQQPPRPPPPPVHQGSATRQNSFTFQPSPMPNPGMPLGQSFGGQAPGSGRGMPSMGGRGGMAPAAGFAQQARPMNHGASQMHSGRVLPRNAPHPQQKQPMRPMAMNQGGGPGPQFPSGAQNQGLSGNMQRWTEAPQQGAGGRGGPMRGRGRGGPPGRGPVGNPGMRHEGWGPSRGRGRR